ncbi:MULTISPECIES: excinuclease ABC subunit UvrA [Thiorhodovibrio]|uniref:excinuclease ABC subunit UvrA n=1 Tax=Thiorhodovibrio TaxID=61593 RepID=UPI0019114729|nr:MULTISPECIES: excinuclease ABC subunit UvrA [Thiorhodovibrio]MBK5969592.1 excinuclease ABC subunit A [Thiorhodovibrio winogradskyi]WPL14660.1 Excinuclease ABC subunit A [Thiorhodovibrio litoralis]
MDQIRIRGARTHNLKNIDLDLPRNRLVVMTGLSGSGKSSLAFDTLYAEGQRRYVESLSAYARQFLSLMEKPDVDHIEGLSPAISIEQKTSSHNPRSTVGTITEIHDYLRLLFARIGIPHCPEHDEALAAQTVTQMVDQILARPEGEKLMLLAPIVSDRKGEYQALFAELNAQGFVRARIDGALCELDVPPALDAKARHDIEVVVDRFRVRADRAQRLAESLETALALSGGLVRLAVMDEPGAPETTFSANFACPRCGYSLSELEPRLFSFNNPAGACPACDGLGHELFFDPDKVVQQPALSLAEGAIRGWDSNNRHTFRMLQALAAHLGFDLETPWHALPAPIQAQVLRGTGQDKLKLKLPHERGSGKQRVFEGVLPMLERRYRETDSTLVREELGRYLSRQPCPACNGTRLNRAARHVRIGGKNLPELSALPVGDCLRWFDTLELSGQRAAIGEKILVEIIQRLRFLADVGLTYLSLSRGADTLSGGEAQRIRLASQIGAGLVGVMYILDEPSIGLHQRDNARLLDTLRRLRDSGNTVIVVEHDEEAMRAADEIVDLGPGAGVQGGRIIAQGTAAEIMAQPDSLTGQYLSGARRIEIPAQRRTADGDRWLRLLGASGNNLQEIDIAIPVGIFCAVTGVSGSGKSTLINDTLYPILARELNQITTGASTQGAPYRELQGLEHFDKVIDIDQSPIGRTPRSNAATYTGLFGLIRELFAAVPESRARGYGPGRFSFNVKGGRCEACKGDGLIRVEMHFLPDLYVPCDACGGRRYNRETLEIRYKGKTIDEVLNLTVEDALAFFAPVPKLKRKLDTLMSVGLTYIALGQSATTLSGGEAQRIKLSRELSRRDTGRTLYILDEPTTGLHFEDVRNLLAVLHQLRERGNTVIVIEHNLDVIKTADWVIDLGPEGGDGGGRLVAAGTPEAVAEFEGSQTGRFLRRLIFAAA